MDASPASPRGALLVVATPIGNLGDMTARAVEALARADLVASEDTRRTGRLLAHLGLEKPQLACHKFSEARRLAAVLNRLADGATVALVTDSGTPGLSDPGRLLVAAAHAAGHQVIPVPGPSAVAAALSAAGLPADHFHFAGFLSVKSSARRRELQRLAAFEETLVFFEAPHRLARFLADALEVLGDRPAVLCREMTKLHEEVRRTTLGALTADIAGRPDVLGEVVLVVGGREGHGGARPEPRPDRRLASRWKAALAHEEGDERRAMRRLARELGAQRIELRRMLEDAGLLA